MLFFFSSRRRHTRSLCDWSSDVCSSDLASASPQEPDPAVTALVAALGRDDLRQAAREGLRLAGPAAVAPVAARLPGATGEELEIGRASCRERGEVAGGAVS